MAPETMNSIAAGAYTASAGGQKHSKFSIGIDLGTTHCALSYVDCAASDGERVVQQVMGIPQLTGPASVESPPLLPSFLYLPHDSELTPGDRTLPWGEQDAVVGELARTRGAATPIRLVSSAKSWLCHPGVDRRGAAGQGQLSGREFALVRQVEERGQQWLGFDTGGGGELGHGQHALHHLFAIAGALVHP
jgi:hypothetical protein